MNNLKSHILSNGIIEIMPITTNYDNNILPPPPKLRRSPRGVDCGITNPPYEKELKLNTEKVNDKCTKEEKKCPDHFKKVLVLLSIFVLILYYSLYKINY